MRWLLITLFFAGCSDPYGDAKSADTIEAWQKYLDTQPKGSHLLFAEDRLEELLTKQAEASQKLADYDTVLKRFPNSRNKKKLQETRVKLALAVATEQNTPEAWATFDKENPFADPAIKRQTQAKMAVSRYAPSLGITEPVVKQVNLAEDPKGPLNGWGFTADVTNNGDQTITKLVLEVQLVDDKGVLMTAYTYPVVSPTFPNGQAAPTEFAAPMAPGDKRTWSYATDKVPEGWTQKAKLYPSFITFAAPAK